MPVHNAEVSRLFDEYADLLEISGANQFRIRAYRAAARNISLLSHNIADAVARGEDLTEIPGIGKDLAAKITEIVKTGRLAPLEEIKKTIPEELIVMTQIAGLGPKRAYKLYQELGISSLTELDKAAREGRIRKIPGFGEKTEQAILEDIQRRIKVGESKRLKLNIVEELAQPLLAYLRQIKGVKRVEAAGSYRRGMETVGDLDILVIRDETSDIMDRFVDYDDVEKVISKGPTRSTVILRYGLQVDVRAVPEESYGAALHYFTGSKPHNIAVRLMGVKRGLKINEYGIFQGETLIGGKTEEEVFASVGLPYIEPELRENRGEIEAAQGGRLPKLVTLEDIRGDLHAHTSLTDGRSSLEEMARAAQKLGYEYLAITEHSRRLTVARGLNEDKLSERNREIDALNEKLDNLTLLKGIEVDILEDGSLDLSESVLKELDLVTCAVHSRFNLSQEKQTERIIRAMRHPYFMILAHPTGRIIDYREPYEVDMEQIVKAARETGCVLELNAQPERLDLTDVYCQMARDMDVRISISTDAHSVDELRYMKYGVIQGRRGWLESRDIINTMSLKQLKVLMKRRLAKVV